MERPGLARRWFSDGCSCEVGIVKSWIADFENRVVVITGAGSGIGKALALEFLRRGARIAACDIDGEGLRTLLEESGRNGLNIFTRVVDVSRAWQVEEFAREVFGAYKRVDILVNCAGVGMGGFFELLSLDDLEWVVRTNIMGVLYCCHYFYPGMVKQEGKSHIVNVSSGAGLVPLPIMTVYCATKAAVLSFTEVLRQEASSFGIGVTAVCPGFVATNIIEKGKIRARGDLDNKGDLARRVDRFFKRHGMRPERVAEAVIKGVEKNKPIVKVGREIYLGDFIFRLSRSFYRLVMRKFVRLVALLQRG